jgi:putative endonuclease
MVFMPYTYIVKCIDGTFYTGWTTNLEARLKAHNEGKGGRYTRSRTPVEMVYWEPKSTRSEAQKRETEIKCLSRKEKRELIEDFTKNVTKEQ